VLRGRVAVAVPGDVEVLEGARAVALDALDELALDRAAPAAQAVLLDAEAVRHRGPRAQNRQGRQGRPSSRRTRVTGDESIDDAGRITSAP
jgi:hypothetical protein